jgi:hypothetical protein
VRQVNANTMTHQALRIKRRWPWRLTNQRSILLRRLDDRFSETGLPAALILSKKPHNPSFARDSDDVHPLRGEAWVEGGEYEPHSMFIRVPVLSSFPFEAM